MKKSRLEWVDIAKGIAIIMMVVGHSTIPDFANRFIYSFHMPLFFIMSGYTSNFAKHGVGDYLRKKTSSLLVPFIIYSIINIVLQSYAYDIPLDDYTYCLLRQGWQAVPLWFIPVLFASLIIVRLMYCLKSQLFILTFAFIFLLVSYILALNKIQIPWNMSVAGVSVFFLVIGNQFRIIDLQSLSSKNVAIGGGICLCLALIVSHFCRLDMCWNQILPIVPILIGAVAGTIFVSTCSILIERKTTVISKVLQRIGNETFLILAYAEITIVLLNHWFNLNPIIKYFILTLILTCLVSVKNIIIKTIKPII